MGLFNPRAWTFTYPLGVTAWWLLGAIPAAIILLYFLKLRRRPISVPSTLLWRRSIEDLHVNSLFQRLRRNLLLFLQLLAVGLVLLALAGPRYKGSQDRGQRFVLAIDESASMGATDVAPSRLEAAKAAARKVIATMAPGDLAMIIAFADNARVVANYTGDRDALRRRLDAIEPTEQSTSLREALQLVAGLANPQKYLEPGEGVVATSVVPPTLYVFTDGAFADVPGFSLGNIEPRVVPIGPPPQLPPPPSAEEGAPAPATPAAPRRAPSDNVALLALRAARAEDDPEQLQLFGRAHNYRAEPVTANARLFRHDPARPGAAPSLVDAVALEIPAQSDQAFQFDLRAGAGDDALEVRLDVEDALALDNRAFVATGGSRKARVLLVAERARFLAGTLRTESMRRIADLTEMTPEQAGTPEARRDLAAGLYDLVIFDGAAPLEAPESNTLYVGALPPGLPPERTRRVEGLRILDWDTAHPLLQYVRDLGSIALREATRIEPPEGARTLIDSNQGPVAVAIPRGAHLDVVLGFALVRGREFNTDWPLKVGFPLFMYNCVRILGNARDAAGEEPAAPGRPVTLRLDAPAERLDVLGPDGRRVESVTRSARGTFVVTQTRHTGLYQARWGERPEDRLTFAVNLFDPRESDLATRGQVPAGVSDEQAEAYRIKIGYTPVAAVRSDELTLRDWWWPIVLVALVVVLVEWVVYNRRVAI
jgi:hypothetical protein